MDNFTLLRIALCKCKVSNENMVATLIFQNKNALEIEYQLTCLRT